VNSLLHRDSEDEEHEAPHGDREITLGTTMILAIFFALAVFAAIFFGFGYSMGSKRAGANATVGDPAVAMPTGTSTGKPAAGNASNGSAPAAVHNDDEPRPANSAAAEAKSSALQRIVASPSHAHPLPWRLYLPLLRCLRRNNLLCRLPPSRTSRTPTCSSPPSRAVVTTSPFMPTHMTNCCTCRLAHLRRGLRPKRCVSV